MDIRRGNADTGLVTENTNHRPGCSNSCISLTLIGVKKKKKGEGFRVIILKAGMSTLEVWRNTVFMSLMVVGVFMRL